MLLGVSCNTAAVEKNLARFDVRKAEIWRFYVQHQIYSIVPSILVMEVPNDIVMWYCGDR
jgi:hypothetical protein